MTRIVVGDLFPGGLTVRLWWRDNGESGRLIQCLELAERFRIEHAGRWIAPLLEAKLLAFFSEDDGLSAYEILITETGNGIVGYIEWP